MKWASRSAHPLPDEQRQATLLAEVMDAATGEVLVGRFTAVLHTTVQDLARTAGLPRESMTKADRQRSPRTQGRLREMAEVLNRIELWAGSLPAAMAWYRAQPIPGFGGRTAESLVKSGQAEALRRYLDHVALGGFA